jgi:uncharacterized protein YuzE
VLWFGRPGGGSLVSVTYYDRRADIVYFELAVSEVARSEEREWGLIDFGPDDATVGIEYWSASRRLPADMLAALPDPSRPLEAATK